MTVEISMVLALLLSSVYLFTKESMPPDLIALLVLSALMVTGLVTPEEGLAGFSNPATITIAAMFVLSAGISQTQMIELLGLQMERLIRKGYLLALGVMMVTVGIISAFINNTATVALLIPVVLSVCRTTKLSPAKLLMPLSFASLLGGMCTLMGTSTNILISTLAQEAGMKPFTLFEFLPLGLALCAISIFFFLTFGHKILPEQASKDLASNFEMAEYLTEVEILDHSESVNKSIAEAPLLKALDVDIVHIERAGVETDQSPVAERILKAGDTLLIRCDLNELKRIEKREGIALKSKRDWDDQTLDTEEIALVEVVVAPRASQVGQTLEHADFPARYQALVLALRQHGDLQHHSLLTSRISAGTAILLKVRREQLASLKADPDFVVVSELDLIRASRGHSLKAGFILLAVLASAAAGWLPITVTAVVGAVAMCLTGVINLDQAYRAIEWKVLMLLVGLLPLGTAMQKTGAADLLAANLVGTLGLFGPVALLSGLFLMTSCMTALMSNTATAALLTPIAISAASSLQIDPRPLLVAVTFGASTAFMTPMGYQTNLMIYSAGRYEFKDFLRVGAPLNLACWLMATLLIPYLWPF